MKRVPIVGVMGASSREYSSLSVPVGELIARKGYHLLTGAGTGVMNRVSEAFCRTPPEARRGRCIGIVPTLKTPEGRYEVLEKYLNSFVEIPIITPLPTLREAAPGQLNRNTVNILTSDIVIALPGGHGTVNEIELSLEYGKPLRLFGRAEDFYSVPQGAPFADTIEDLERFIDKHLVG